MMTAASCCVIKTVTAFFCTVCSRISGERAFYPDTMCPLCAASQNTRSKCTLHNLHTAVQSTLLQLLSLPPDTIKYTCATVRK